MVGQQVVPNNRLHISAEKLQLARTNNEQHHFTEAGDADARGDYSQLRVDLLRQLNHMVQEYVL